MAIHDSANPANVRRSLEKYVVDSWVGTSGFPADFLSANVWYQGRKIATGGLDYFLRVSFDEIERLYSKAADAGVPGYIVGATMLLEVWAKRVKYDATPHTADQAMAVLRGKLIRGTSIAIKNYDSGDGTTLLSYAVIEKIQPIKAPEDEVWYRQTVEASLTRHERDTAS